MSGVDVIGQAQTGTGKTASFGIPVLHKVDPNSRKTQVIILSPTRELAIQVADEIRKLAKYMHRGQRYFRCMADRRSDARSRR